MSSILKIEAVGEVFKIELIVNVLVAYAFHEL
jgi:hypothetical protein